MTKSETGTIHTLGDRGMTVDGSANDVRGREVKDEDGRVLGHVAELLVDEPPMHVRFLLVEHGGFLGLGSTRTLIPVDAISEVTEHTVVVDQTSDRVASAPAYSPDLVDDRPYHAHVYDHYGYVPYWGAGYVSPLHGVMPSRSRA